MTAGTLIPPIRLREGDAHALPRVLHIIDAPGAGWDAFAAAAHCARSLPHPQRLLLIGDRDAAADALAFGLEPEHHICPPLNRLAAAVAPFDRALADIRAQWPFDVIHLWSDSARVLCRETVGFDLPITQEDPALFAALFDRGDRQAARAALGLAPDETAFLLAGDRPGVGDARRFAGLLGILHLAEFPCVGVASTRSDTYRRAARLLRGFKREWDVIPFRLPPHLALAAADAVIYDQGDSITADAGPGHPVGGIVFAAAAAAIPVITVQSPLTRRLLGPLAEELAAADGSLPELARVAVQFCIDPRRRAAAGNRLREHLAAFPTPRLHDRWSAAVHTGGAA